MATKLRILLVDDRADQLDYLARFFSQNGFAVLTCTDGDEAIAAMEGMHFDALVSDIQMPRVNGLELIEWTHVNRPETIIIAITAFGSSILYTSAMSKGAVVYLEKPVDPKLLLEVLKTTLETKACTGGLLDSCIEANQPGSAGEVVVRAGPQVGRILFSDGHVVWATSPTLSFINHVAQATGLALEEVKTGLSECQQSGQNFVDYMVAKGQERAQMEQLLFEWIVRCTAEMSDWEDQQSIFLPIQRSYSGDVAFELTDILHAVRTDAERHKISN